MENNQSIGAKIVVLRKAKGCTQADLGAYLNISYQAVSKWERDESCPDFATLSRIAQYFGVPIAYFEEGGEVAATLAAQPAQAIETKEMLGVCKECGKMLYKGDEQEGADKLICKKCHAQQELARTAREKEKARQQEQFMREKAAAKAKEKREIAKARNRGLIWGGIIAGLLLIFSIYSVVSTPSEDMGSLIVTAIVMNLITFTFVSQLFWDGAVFDCATTGGKIVGTPGVIFEFSLDGFIFLIAMKILFAIIKFIFWLLSLLFFVVIAYIISPFTFVPALLRVNREGII